MTWRNTWDGFAFYMTYIGKKRKEKKWIHCTSLTWANSSLVKQVIITTTKNNNTNEDCKMMQKLHDFCKFWCKQSFHNYFQANILYLIPGVSRLLGLINCEILICFKNMGFLQTVSSFWLFIIYFDSQKCDFLCLSALKSTFWHEPRCPVTRIQRWPLCWSTRDKQSQCNWGGKGTDASSWYMCPLCLGDGGRGWIQTTGCSHPILWVHFTGYEFSGN